MIHFRHPEARAKGASRGDGRSTRAASFEGRFRGHLRITVNKYSGYYVSGTAAM